jgi:hypothetical protein
MGTLGSAPTASFDTSTKQQIVMWKGTDNNSVWEAYWTPGGGWSGPNDVPHSSDIVSRPSVAYDSNQKQQIIFWQGGASDSPPFTLHEEYYAENNQTWYGPNQVSIAGAGTMTLGSPPTVTFDSATNSNQQIVYWKAGSNNGYDGTALIETYWTPGSGWSWLNVTNSCGICDDMW